MAQTARTNKHKLAKMMGFILTNSEEVARGTSKAVSDRIEAMTEEEAGEAIKSILAMHQEIVPPNSSISDISFR